MITVPETVLDTLSGLYGTAAVAAYNVGAQILALSFLPGIGFGTAASVRFMAEHANYFALVDVERSDPAIDDALRSGSEVYLDDVTALVRAAQQTGQVPDADPRLLALGVLGAVSSFSNAWRRGQIAMSADDLAGFVADWVVRALR